MSEGNDVSELLRKMSSLTRHLENCATNLDVLTKLRPDRLFRNLRLELSVVSAASGSLVWGSCTTVFPTYCCMTPRNIRATFIRRLLNETQTAVRVFIE